MKYIAIFLIGLLIGISLFLTVPWLRAFTWVTVYGDLCQQAIERSVE